MKIKFKFYIFMFLFTFFAVDSIKSSENVLIIKHASYYIRELNKQKTHYVAVTFYTFDGNEILKTTQKEYIKNPKIYLDKTAPKPQPVNYLVNQRNIKFFNKHDDVIAKCQYDEDQIILWDKNNRNRLEFNFPTDNLNDLDAFELDLSVVNKIHPTIKDASYYIKESMYNPFYETHGNRKDFVSFYTYNGKYIDKFSGQFHAKHPDLFLDPRAPKPQPLYYFITLSNVINFYDKYFDIIQSYPYNPQKKEIIVQDKESNNYIFNFPTDNLKEFNNFPLDLIAVKEAPWIKNASYYTVVKDKQYNPISVTFYTFDGNEILKTTQKKYLNDPREFLDKTTRKPRPVWYDITSYYGSSGGYIPSPIPQKFYNVNFYDKHNNLIEKYNYQAQKYDYQEQSKGIQIWNSKEQNDYFFSFPTTNIKELDNFPLDLTIVKEKLLSKYWGKIKLTLGLLGILYAIHKLGDSYEIKQE